MSNVKPLSNILNKLLVLVVLLISLNGCAVNYLVDKLDPTARFSESNKNVLSTGELSAGTVQELRILDLEEQFRKDPAKVITTMEDSHIGGRETEQAQARAETAFFYANKLCASGKRLKSAEYYLMAAANAYDFLFYNNDKLSQSYVSPFGRYMTELYNAAISKIVDIRETEKAPWDLPWQVQIGTTLYRFTRNPDLENQAPPKVFEKYTPAYDIKASSLKNLYSSQGIGAPFVGERKNTPGAANYDPFATPVVSSPVTILFQFSPRVGNSSDAHNAVRDVMVSVINPFKQDTVRINNSEYPIEADYSAAFGVMLSRVNPGRYVLDALLNAGQHIDKIRLTFVQPYDPTKIPVVLVHGLYSSPATYIQMVNDLMGVDEIRKKYQFWVFSYPTGLPIVATSTHLRAALREAAKKFDPDGTSPTFNQMVIIGHSMGGILSRSMVIENSDKVWSAFFTVPIDKLNLTDEERVFLREVGQFEALPFIHRAVFIAAPLRGSEVAKASIVSRLTRWLISVPATIISKRNAIFSKNKEYLNPELNNDDFISVAKTSVDNLRPDSPILAGYINTPISSAVTYHSIIGVQDSPVGPGSDDGVVRYESSHLDGAASEKLVPSPHSCLEHPATIAEVRRILLLHLKEGRGTH